MTSLQHRTVETNGIQMHLAEQGSGPLVVLCHGFPELAHSWRHQIPVLAEAGYRVIAPDMRGYGKTERPEAIDQYSIFHLVGDMVGLVGALGADQAVIVGHDWGAPVAWTSALMRPDRFRAVAALSVPYRPRSPVKPSTVMPRTEDSLFYQAYFQEPGVAEAELERDVHRSLAAIMTGAFNSSGGEAPAIPGMVRLKDGFLGGLEIPDAPPAWLPEAELEPFVAAFQESGFRGGLNWYRNIDRNWELMAPYAGAPITVPALYLAGDRDLVVRFPGMMKAIEGLKRDVPLLRETVLFEGCGHWTQQERSDEVNAALIRFLKGL
jgi:pimeloyl-ACP methyl ester carboxylesterase